MQRLTKGVLIGSAALGIAIGSFSVASATSGAVNKADDDGPNEAADSDAPITGTDLDRAVAAALEHTGGGEVTETEIGDDGAAFGVEIRRSDGSQVEVNLDSEFNVIGSAADDD